jgi:DNA repair protein RadC
MPPEERPRQRFLRSGGEALSDAEVLSLVLGSGSRDVCPLELAREVLDERGGLLGLVGVSPELLRRRGLGEAKAASVLASVELACRLARREVPKRAPLERPASVARYLVLRYTTLGQEVMGALYVDARNRLIGDREIYRGALSRATVEPREIFLQALVRGASSLVLFHTHPSGDPDPSLEDLQFTRRMKAAGEALGVGLLDHLIVGSSGRWVSLRDRGVFR